MDRRLPAECCRPVNCSWLLGVSIYRLKILKMTRFAFVLILHWNGLPQKKKKNCDSIVALKINPMIELNCSISIQLHYICTIFVVDRLKDEQLSLEWNSSIYVVWRNLKVWRNLTLHRARDIDWINLKFVSDCMKKCSNIWLHRAVLSLVRC